VAAPGIVVTNAHVVAGEQATTVEAANGVEVDAAVVAFDPYRDLAVLRAPTLQAPPLKLEKGAVKHVGAGYGHPGGGRLTAAPARVGEEILAVGTDIYRTQSSRRHVYVLAANLKPGDSGGPLVDQRGDVIGVAFAIDPGHAGTSYALTDAEVHPVLDPVVDGQRARVATGGCLVD
jgi:S1-C subfamily serine protease